MEDHANIEIENMMLRESIESYKRTRRTNALITVAIIAESVSVILSLIRLLIL